MKHLQDMVYLNELAKIERVLQLQEAEYTGLLEMEVMINEQDENQLNAILNDAERRIEAAKRGLSAASKLKDPVERKAHVARMMGHLNRTRSLLDKVVKEFFPEKIEHDDGVRPGGNMDEFVTPQQAAEALGVHPSRIQALVSANKLRMYNNNGRWALKGAEVQALANQGGTGGGSSAPKPASANRADFSQFVK